MRRRGRLAPSPTGAQHLGNARTFLLAYWSSSANDEQLSLRIEDIDSPRVKPWAAQQAIDDLRWLGIRWSGEITVQTDRTRRYNEILSFLRRRNRIYPCVCSRRDIEAAASAPHETGLHHEGPVYPGTCAAWRDGDRVPEGRPLCWRFRVAPGNWSFVDTICGPQSIDVQSKLGDFPVTRKGNPSRSDDQLYPPAAYQLAVVVDDIDHEITDVVRGDDLLASTLRQLQLFDAIGAAPPRFAHVPLVCGSDGRRLAKRHGDTRLSQYREQGVPPEKVVRWAASVSGYPLEHLSPGEPLESIHQDVIDSFSWDRLPKDPIILDRHRGPGPNTVAWR
ncbi:MAG: glutamate--tRNA ligase family protein [Planctomycetota bacterium]